MNLVLYTHPEYFGSYSHRHFARMLCEAFQQRGHRAVVRQPAARLRRRFDGDGAGAVAKWAGYVDQFLLYPWQMRRDLRSDPADTLYVFCDQALGPLMPWVVRRPHVVHCHDLLALRSALGLVPENRTSASGRVYQHWIRAGFRRARHFISVSEQTRRDLHGLGGVRARVSEVVYNGLNHDYGRLPRDAAAACLREGGIEAPPQGILLHVGGGQWYKNLAGVIALYGCYVVRMRAAGRDALPLWLVSPAPDAALAARIAAIGAPGAVRFLPGQPARRLEALYVVARALLFPSLAEGFGWPIAEALACGCPVLTTGEAPMTEVGGPHAHYLPRMNAGDEQAWAEQGATTLLALLDRDAAERESAARAAMDWARRFDAEQAIAGYLAVYERVLALEQAAAHAAES